MRDTQTLGDAAELRAAAWFRDRGYKVAIPIGSPMYDLIVDRDGHLSRVQVKATTQRGHVSRNGKDWGWVVIVKCRENDFDELYIETPDLHYLIPRNAFGENTRHGVTVPSRDDWVAGTTSQWVGYVVCPPEGALLSE